MMMLSDYDGKRNEKNCSNVSNSMLTDIETSSRKTKNNYTGY